jgi:hypothetical protein
MTGNQFRTALKNLGLTQMAAARLFFVDGRTVRRWAAGTAPIPHPVVIVLRLMRKYQIDTETVSNLGK